MIESPIEDYVCGKAEEHGWLVRKLGWVGRRSGPDRFFAKGGRVVFIEFKRPGKDATAPQQREIDRMLKAGVEVHVVSNPLTGLRLLGISHA